MLNRLVWQENDLHAIQLKIDLYIVAQLLPHGFVAFFNVQSSTGMFDQAVDLNAIAPIGVCAVMKKFIKTCSTGKISNLSPRLNIVIPELFISKDRGQWENRAGLTDDQLIYNLVRIDPVIGDKGIMGNEIVAYNIDRSDPSLGQYEITGYNTGYELVRRLLLSVEYGRWVDPLKEQWLAGEDNYPLKTVAEMWEEGVPKYA